MARRSLAATPTTRRRAAVCRAVVLLVLALATSAPAVAQVVFIGNNVVDLKWNPPGPGVTILYYRVLRDGGEVWRKDDPTVTFFRDTGVIKGHTYTYQLCSGWQDVGGVRETCGNSLPVTAGQVQGRLWQDWNWGADLYTLYDDVWVEPGVTLTITGSTVGVAANAPRNHIYGYGDLRTVGAQFTDVNIEFRSTGNNYLRSSTFEQNKKLVRIYISPQANAEIADSTFAGATSTANPYIELASGAGRLVVRGSVFHNAGIGWGSGPSGDHSEVVVAGNQFADGSGVELDYATGTITDNAFVGLGPDSGEAAIIARAAVVTIEGNIIRGFEEGIGLTLETTGQITGNTLRGNRTGISFGSGVSNDAVTINQNCIAGNSYGLSAFPSLQVNARSNWWGDPSGPKSTSNPLGKGDRIYGDQVDVSQWLTDDNCHEAPLPTPTATVPPTATPVSIPTHTPRPAALSVEAAPTQVIPNGMATTTVSAVVTDNQGHPVANVQVAFTLDPPALGTVQPSACTTGGEGSCTVTYTAATPEAVFQQNDVGAAFVTISAAVAGLAPSTTRIQFVYLRVLNTSPVNGAENQDLVQQRPDGSQGVTIQFDRLINSATFSAVTFKVRSQRYFTGTNCLPCFTYDTAGSTVNCLIDDTFYPNVRKGLVATAELEGGPQGIRGQDGAMLKTTYAWVFGTLPVLTPRIIPVQVSEAPSASGQSPTSVVLVKDKPGVIRVHAGLPQDTELPGIDAKVDLIGSTENEHVDTYRFLPGELGGSANGITLLALKGNSANWLTYKSMQPTWYELSASGGQLTARLTPVGQLVSYSAQIAVKETAVTPNLTYAVWPVAPKAYPAGYPAYGWQPGQELDAWQFTNYVYAPLDRWLPLSNPGAPGHLATNKVSASTAEAVPPTTYPWALAREFDTRSRRSASRWSVVLVPGDWLRAINQGDSIWHGRSFYTCVLGSDAPEEAVAHCFGHLSGLLDDVWGSPPLPFPLGHPVMKGFDMGFLTVVNNAYPDLMGGGYSLELMDSSLGKQSHAYSSVWIDVNNYQTLFQKFLGGTSSAAATRPNIAIGDPLTIGGEVIVNNGAETGALDAAVLPDPAAPFPIPTDSGEYSLRLRAGSGSILAAYAFPPEFETLDAGLDYASFMFHVTAPSGTAVIELLHGDQVLATKPVSANPPQVMVTQPTGGTYSGMMDVAWSADDPDGDTDLHFQVLYSPDDGSTWQPVVLDATEQQVTIDTTMLPSSQQCRIRIVGDDGVRQGEADSAAFAVINPPQVVYAWPPDGAVDVPRYTEIRATFRDAMNADSFDASTFTLTDGKATRVGGTVSYDEATYTAAFAASAPLTYGGQYTARLDGSVLDAQGQALGAAYVWSFQLEPLPFCAGDCNGDGAVTVDELLTLVNIALGNTSLFDCQVGDVNEDDQITIDEILTGVNLALNGCP